MGGIFKKNMKEAQIEELGFIEKEFEDEYRTYEWTTEDNLASIYVTYQEGEVFVDLSIDSIKPLNVNITKLKQLMQILNEL